MTFKRKRYLALLLLVMAMLITVADFHRWVSTVGNLSRPDAPKADAVVALTGGSGKRIQAAIALLEQKAGERLLVSGVHISVDTRDLIKTAGGTEALFSCCIDIGHEANSTQENAIETSAWAKKKGYKSIVLVTSDYHMPRSLLWFREKAPELSIVAYPMQSQLRPKTWWKSWKSFRGLVTEWAKYRVTVFLLAF